MHVATPCQLHDHVAQFYEDEATLADRVASFLTAGVSAGERLLMLLTPPRRRAVLARLEAWGLDTAAAEASGQLVVRDAESLLEAIMDGDMPDEARFNRHVLAEVESAGAQPTRAFGELVDVLCARGQSRAAVYLESLWHAACRRLPLTLLCGYALEHFREPEGHDAFAAVCDHHSRVLPAGEFCGLAPHDQLREVTRLQREVAHLRQELAERQGVEQTLTAVQGLCSEMLGELAEQARHDDLTGLTTRQYAQQRLAELLAEAGEGSGRIAVLHIDIDQLKAINDSLGLETGDDFLRQTAQRIRHCLADSEVVSRLGSDEMMAVLAGVAEPDAVVARVERLIARVSEPVEVEGQTIAAGCCVGISLSPDHGRTVAELMRSANLARRHAQSLGRRRHHLFSAELIGDEPDRLALRTALSEALPRGELALYFRPRLGARSGQVVAVSAQPRWYSARFGVMEPEQWMAAIEEANQVEAIGQWVLDGACEHAQAWIEAGVELRVAVQITSADLLGGAFVERVAAALASSGLPGTMLELELTESALMQAPVRAEATLVRLKALGVHLTVDEFGSGRSILGHLGRFPVDTIKFSGAFVDGCLENAHHQAIIRSVVMMAHQLGISVTAGGVATRAQADYLREQGCDGLEGPLWSRMEYRGNAVGEAAER
ncbi:EAL domain-containing protein [Halomonas sp. NO4]|uniref:putative bifunctional diguanylate cyclase/phosphodiesterase n=1 Tax=Halomonas sp. NO4 TaxID=2484813 RepID=UPI0013D77402|nr:EAL domain-containing protein [Halomonas sp. NO4]